MKIRLRLIALALVLLPLSAFSAPILTVVGGELQGASGVEVNGILYDVEFVDGSCISVFSGCDEASDFTFNTLADATSASQALIDTVFLDYIFSFDSDPELTRGCTATDTCFSLTVFGSFISGTLRADVAAARNASSEAGDLVNYPSIGASIDQSNASVGSAARITFVRWTQASSVPVPAPSSLIMLVLGLFGLYTRTRR